MFSSERPIETLKALRKKAVYAVVNHSLTQKESADLFGFSPTSMSKYYPSTKNLIFLCCISDFFFPKKISDFPFIKLDMSQIGSDIDG